MQSDPATGQTPSADALIYGLDDRPDPFKALLAAAQHVLASIVGIVTPTLVIGDWNMSPWSGRFAGFLEEHGLHAAFPGGIPGTTRFFHDYRLRRFLGAVVDNVAASNDVFIETVALGPDTGSDHVALIVDLRLPAAESR